MKRIEQLTIKFIDENRLLVKGDRILAALSGGADSVFMLRFLNKFKNRFGIELGALHINHQLRGKNSDQDEKFCMELCGEFQIPFYAVSVDVKKISASGKISIEEAARNARYDAFEKVAKKNHYNKIATAHNIGDNAETVLLNLIKGTGIRGVAGIPVTRGNIIRPLLAVSKKEIEKFLDENGISFRTDESNSDSIFERNFLRNEVIPLLKSRFGEAFEENIFRSSGIFRNYSEVIASQAGLYMEKACKFTDNELEISLNEIENPLLWGDVIALALKNYYSYTISYEDIKKILELSVKRNRQSVELREKLTASRISAKIIGIGFKHEISGFIEKKISVGEKIRINDKEDVYISLSDKKNVEFTPGGKKEYISGDELSENFVIRRWKAGDKFKPLGLKGYKKISDFLNEQKIFGKEKSEQLVLTQDNKIIWVIGKRIDDRYKLKENTNKVLEICQK
jgi:tRNA(Ile)-lysidine synthase